MYNLRHLGYNHSQLCPPARRFLARNLPGENLLQIVFLPAMTIGHKDSVLIIGDDLGHVLSVILLVILSNVGIEGVV